MVFVFDTSAPKSVPLPAPARSSAMGAVSPIVRPERRKPPRGLVPDVPFDVHAHCAHVAQHRTVRGREGPLSAPPPAARKDPLSFECLEGRATAGRMSRTASTTIGSGISA